MRLFFVLAFFFTLPNQAKSSFETQALEISSSITSGKHKGLTSFILLQDHTLIAESYSKGTSRETLHDLRSVTKSISSLLIGLALEKGLIEGVEESLYSMSKETPYFEFASPSITLKDLLTMRAGLACDDWVPASLGNEDKMYLQPDWAKFILSLPKSHESGKHFSYCTGGAVVLGHLLSHKLNSSFVEWADRKLFQPMKIEKYQWATTPYGMTDTGGHLKMRAIDLAKLGNLLLYKGKLMDHQIVNANWISESTTRHTKVYERRFEYGYWWWKDWLNTSAGKTDVTFAWGNGGQYIFIVPDYKVVAVFTGTNFNHSAGLLPQKLFAELVALL